MPKGKNKKFIDKKNAVTFHLVHRSQQDPLVVDETAPQRVLVPVDSVQVPKISNKQSTDIQKRKEEQKKFGIFFDDDYDYLQHLKDVNKLEVDWAQINACENDKIDKNDKKSIPKIKLPSSVFASTVEEEVGLLNKAIPISGPRLDVDPDVVAAMDDDFDYDDPDNQLEDNFMELANGDESENDILNEEDESENDEDEDEVCSLNGQEDRFIDEEVKSRFTEYSMSSSVIKRNNQLTLLDNKFEKIFASYDENEIGALDCEEIEGHISTDSGILLEYATEFEEERKEPAQNIAKLMEYQLYIIKEDCSSSEEAVENIILNPLKKEFDCESILSTYSNIYNHPKLISEPKKSTKLEIDKRTGIPKNVFNEKSKKLTVKSLAQFNNQNEIAKIGLSGLRPTADTVKSILSILSIRPKDELPVERKQRKKALKNYRKERRIERKANTEAFKEEKKQQEKAILNNKINKGIVYDK